MAAISAGKQRTAVTFGHILEIVVLVGVIFGRLIGVCAHPINALFTGETDTARTFFVIGTLNFNGVATRESEHC